MCQTGIKTKIRLYFYVFYYIITLTNLVKKGDCHEDTRKGINKNLNLRREI